MSTTTLERVGEATEATPRRVFEILTDLLGEAWYVGVEERHRRFSIVPLTEHDYWVTITRDHGKPCSACGRPPQSMESSGFYETPAKGALAAVAKCRPELLDELRARLAGEPERRPVTFVGNELHNVPAHEHVDCGCLQCQQEAVALEATNRAVTSQARLDSIDASMGRLEGGGA